MELDKKESKRDKSSLKSNLEILRELFIMIRMNKKWWLLPFFFILAFLSLFVSVTGNTSILPAIYALF